MKGEIRRFDIQFRLKPFTFSITRSRFESTEVTISQAQHRHAEFRDRRPLFATKDNFHHLLDRAHEEIEEARAELPHERPMTPKEREKFGSEIADVFCFVLLASNYAGVDLSQAWIGKMEEIEKRYPEAMFQLGSGTFEEQYAAAKARRTT